MKKQLLDIIACPICHQSLKYDRKRSKLICERDRMAFPVRRGVPVLLEMDAINLEENIIKDQ